MGLCAFHPIYIYTDYYPKLGLTVQSTRHFRLFILGPGPWIFQTTRAVKDAAVPQAPQPSNRSAELHEAALHVGDA
jgi:hypothetical protein